MENYVPSMVSFLLTPGAWRWYVVGAYVPKNDVYVVHWLEQVMADKSKRVGTILLGELNTCLGEMINECTEDLATALSNHGLGDVTRNFTPRQLYKGQGQWMCQIHR